MIARLVYLSWLRRRLGRFLAEARRARQLQHQALWNKIQRHRHSDFGRDHGFASFRSVDDFRQRMPVLTYEDHHPYIARVLEGETTALFAPHTRVLMFAMTSGTTGEPKRLPITAEFLREYRAGWRLWGAGVYGDHQALLRTKTLHITSDWERYRSASGVPCGQISGLAAASRPKVAQRMFLPPAAVSRIHVTAAKHYATLRFALESRRIGMIITANPSTLVEFARRADQQNESLVRDIHDGTLSCDVPPDVRAELARSIQRRQPARAKELERLIAQHGALLPTHAWPHLTVLALWTGGSVGVFFPKLADLYGRPCVRDHGLSASEGRMTIPLADGTSAGVLDFYHHYFEFIPVEEHGRTNPTVLEAHEVEVGNDYFILLTTSGGLYRYDIHDLVRCVGFEGQAPVLEFLNKGKSYSNLAGEKISEHQVIEAAERTFRDVGLPIDTFTLAPVMEDKPRYLLLLEPHVHGNRMGELAQRMQLALEGVNEEYLEKCASQRLLPIEVGVVATGTWDALRREKTAARGNFEEYKHPCLVNDLEFAARLSVRYGGPTQGAAKVS